MANLLRANSFKINETPIIKKISPKFFNIFIEGNIASGKSTMIEHFSYYQTFETVPEPIVKWKNLNGHDIFKMMSTNPHENAYKFQSYVLLTLLEEYLKPQKKPIRILERSIFSQECFTKILNSSGVLDDSSYAVLNEWSGFAKRTFNISADAIIYIQTNPEILLQRILSRGRPEEKNIKLEFLNEVHQYHEKWLLSGNFDQDKLFIINGNAPLVDIQSEYGRCFNFLSSFLK